MSLGLVQIDPDAFPPEPTPCLRCGTDTMLRFAGPCPACVAVLREKFRAVGRAVSDEYVPKLNVTPNAVALKDS
jgi:hypothetical protein